jgi:hypothetical protein
MSHAASTKIALILSLGLTLGLGLFLAAIAFVTNRYRRKHRSYHSPDVTGNPNLPSNVEKSNVQRGQVQQEENQGLGLHNTGMSTIDAIDAMDDRPSPISASPITTAPSRSATLAMREEMGGF